MRGGNSLEYVFGTKDDIEVLKTKGQFHTNMKGFHQVEQEYSDQIITDNFHIVCKLESVEDEEGNCYDWYEIDHHYRVMDKTVSVVKKVEENAAAVENALCEQDMTMNERISVIEDAICEMDAFVNK